jgi:hypothetical protein
MDFIYEGRQVATNGINILMGGESQYPFTVLEKPSPLALSEE